MTLARLLATAKCVQGGKEMSKALTLALALAATGRAQTAEAAPETGGESDGLGAPTPGDAVDGVVRTRGVGCAAPEGRADR